MTWILSLLFLCSCSVNHKIKIKQQPCLYPHQGYDFTLCRDFTYFVDGNKYIVPARFTTDLASIPKILWSVYSPNKANTIAAAVIHDYLYFCPQEMTRREADSIFYDALIFNGVHTSSAFKYWLAVRTFGYTHFNNGAYCSMTISRIRNDFGITRTLGVG